MRSVTLMITIMTICLFKVPVPVQSRYYSRTRRYDPEVLKVTNLHFFLHETIVGESATAVMVAQPNNSSGPFSFGTLAVIDDPLKIGPEHDSEVIGNARGLVVMGDEDATTLVTYLDYGFTSGKFKGSSISVFSRNLITETERELAVVGGRGKFRMAKGVAKLKVYFINATNLVIDYNVNIIHYEDDDN